MKLPALTRLPELDEPTLRYRLGLPPAADVEAEGQREGRRRVCRRYPATAFEADVEYDGTDSPGPHSTGEDP